MPAQPPFLTPTRTPAIGVSARAKISLMRAAAASLRRITWSFGLGLVDGAAIVSSSSCRSRYRQQTNRSFLYVAPRGPERNFDHHMFKATRASRSEEHTSELQSR